MRQAGRYLPEYREVSKKAGGFLAMVRSPELAAEITLQPVRRFGVDAAIVYSDILMPLEAMGLTLTMHEGAGPQLAPVVRGAAEIDRLKPVEPARDLAFVGETLRRVRAALAPHQALLGFAGLPFTLAAYAVEGGNPGNGARFRALIYRHTADFERLMDKLAAVVSAHLRYQIESGADAVVLFDTWAGQLGRDDYLRYAEPWTRRVLESVAGLAPRVVFVREGAHLLEDLARLRPEGLAIDWKTPLRHALDLCAGRIAVQGNLDPAALLAPPAEVDRRARALLAAAAGRPGYILSLGHGVLKETDPESVAAFVAAAREPK
jgi:uroporphyrinogen decarboxylase